MTRIYVPAALAENQLIALDADAARHVAQVLRMKTGEPLTVFNGEGGEFEAAIAAIERRAVQLRIGSRVEVDRESKLSITLAQCVSKGERMDYTIQKAVELGVAAIVPLLSGRSVVRLDAERWDKKLDHWRGIVVSASEQSGRTRLPELAAVQKLERWLETPPPGERLVLAPGGGALRERPAAAIATLLIGPEGGLSESEILLAERAGFRRIGLGPRVLRTETAGVAANAMLQTLWGDFRKG
jgi:16S rRNA (uracil1498-N3)-methyltransferase